MSDHGAKAKALTPQSPPLPGLARMRKRLGDRHALRDDLLARLAAIPADPSAPAGPGNPPLGSMLDVASDPAVVTAAELWSRVADGVGAYAEMTRGELYLGTAQDWTDVARIVNLVGYRPAQRAAARGFIRAEIAPGTSPLLPAGTQVQAPGTPAYAAQTYEVESETQLHPDWHGLTVTAVPVPSPPSGQQIRFLADPGFRSSDRVVLVSEQSAFSVPFGWEEWLLWMIALMTGHAYYGATGMAVRGIAKVTAREDDLGAILLTFDRKLTPLLPAATGTSYAAYRLRAELALAHRLDTLAYISGTTAATAAAPYASGEPANPWDDDSVIVTDASAVSSGQTLILHNGKNGACLVTQVTTIEPMDRHIAPGTVKRVARLSLQHPIPNALRATGLTVLLTDDRQVAQHYELPALSPGAITARVHPRLKTIPNKLAIATSATDAGAANGWELTGCTASAADAQSDTGGQLVSLTDARTGTASRAPATGNVAAIRHGTTNRGTLTLLGDTRSGRFASVAGPVTADVAPDGTVRSSLEVRVGGARYDEVPSLYGRSAAEPVFATTLAADGRLTVRFVAGAAIRGEVTAVWRTGGGLGGEIPSSGITVLATSVTGIRKVAGTGPLTGAADQEDPLRMRRAAAARIRALDRAVALGDLRDLALTMPGTTHSVAWRGVGPPGCACGGSGLHVAVLRMTATGVRPPVQAEIDALAGYLDARRDTTIPLCACAAVASAITIAATVVTDARWVASVVGTAVENALLDGAGPLAAVPRELGTPLDGSDVVAVAQPVTGVIGVTGLTLRGGMTTPTAGDMSLGRLPAEPYELLYAGSVRLGVSSA